MSVFTLAIPCLTTSTLPWFLNLAFQVPMQYYSLQHLTLLVSPVTTTTGYCVCFPISLSGGISPLISSSILGTYQPGSSSFSILSFCLFILFMGFSRQAYWSGLPFPSPVDHISISTTDFFHCIFVFTVSELWLKVSFRFLELFGHLNSLNTLPLA